MNEQEKRIKDAAALIQQRKDLEDELIALETQLKENGVGLDTKLVDSEGFPRADIDIVAIRTIRVQIIEKRNDLKALVGKIEEALIGIHQNVQNPTAAETIAMPFCKIGVISPGSPAEKSGLSLGDKVITFGPVNRNNHHNLTMLSKVATENINSPVTVVVESSTSGKNPKEFTIIPSREWGGNGILGCSFVLL